MRKISKEMPIPETLLPLRRPKKYIYEYLLLSLIFVGATRFTRLRTTLPLVHRVKEDAELVVKGLAHSYTERLYGDDYRCYAERLAISDNSLEVLRIIRPYIHKAGLVDILRECIDVMKDESDDAWTDFRNLVHGRLTSSVTLANKKRKMDVLSYTMPLSI